MKSKESEYKELFLVEALENFEELNKLFIDLEKEHSNKSAINSIFRITHTLKGNAMGMGFSGIADLSHVMEDIMGAVKNGEIVLTRQIFETLFKANDKLGELINAINTGKKVSYLGLKTKLAVILREAKESEPAGQKDTPEVQPAQVEEGEEGAGTDVVIKDDVMPEIAFADVIQIPVKKMDELMNLVGQLIIERDRLMALSGNDGRRTSEFESLQRISSNLQFGIMNARMVQMGFLFNKFHRIVRDAAAIEKKNVSLSLKGTEVEIDRNILKTMSDSLIHLVRNAVSHGIESAGTRKAAGKPEGGSITLNATYEKDRVNIMISDDGKGIDAAIIRKKIVEKGMVTSEVARALSDEDVLMYVFEPGFSSAEKVTEISGRGVGMDVVKRTVESMGGQVKIETETGKGTTITLMLPSSLALKGALLFELDGQEYAIALSYTEAVISLKKNEIHKIGDGLMAQYLDSTISIVFLKDLTRMEDLSEISRKGALHKTFSSISEDEHLDVIIVSYSGKQTGIVIDRLLQRKEIIEKTLPKPLDKIKLLSGTTILGNGNVCPVIDVTAVVDLLYKNVIKTDKTLVA